jgi:hypothetical protein
VKYLLQVLIDHGHRPQVDIQDYDSTKEASYDLEYFSFIEAVLVCNYLVIKFESTSAIY